MLLASAACLAIGTEGMTAPTTQPSVPAAVPVPTVHPAAVQPVAVPVVAQHIVPTKIVIMPFPALGDVQGRVWIGAAVQQSLSADVSRLGGMTVVSVVQGVDVADTNALLKAAKTTQCDTVVSGTCQFAGDEMRITGQVMDIASGKSLGGLKVSGDVRDLFSLEDELSSELRHLLRPAQNPNIVMDNDNGGGIVPNPIVQGMQPIQNVEADDGENYLPNYSPVYNYANPYDYGGYGGYYYYPYSSPTIIIFHHDRDRDGDHHWQGSGGGNGMTPNPTPSPAPPSRMPTGFQFRGAAPAPIRSFGPIVPFGNPNPGVSRYGNSVR